MTMPWRGAWGTVLWAVAWGVASCGADAESGQTGAIAPSEALSPELPASTWLYGSEASCRWQTECATGACYLGRCAGLLSAGAFWAQDLAIETASRATGASPRLKEELSQALARVLSDDAGTETERVRALLAWHALDPERAAPAVEAARRGMPAVERLAATWLTAARGDEDAAAELAGVLAGGHSEVAQALTASVLAGVPGDASEQALVAAASDATKSAAVRLAATRALVSRPRGDFGRYLERVDDPSAPFLRWSLLRSAPP